MTAARDDDFSSVTYEQDDETEPRTDPGDLP